MNQLTDDNVDFRLSRLGYVSVNQPKTLVNRISSIRAQQKQTKNQHTNQQKKTKTKQQTNHHHQNNEKVHYDGATDANSIRVNAVFNPPRQGPIIVV